MQSGLDYSQPKIFGRSLKPNIEYNRIMIMTLKLSQKFKTNITISLVPGMN